jgi:DNA polymerase
VPNALLDAVAAEAAGCTKCPLAYQGRTQVVFGMGNPTADLMFVGEGPGAEEDRQGLPFVGRSGQLLDRLMAEELGIDRSSCYVCNTIKCRPPGNRDPLPVEVETCWPYLDRQLELIDPKVVITLGRFAAHQLLDTKEGINRLRGRVHPYRGRLIVPTFHPAAVLRGDGEAMAQTRADFVRAKRTLVDAGAEPWASWARTPVP